MVALWVLLIALGSPLPARAADAILAGPTFNIPTGTSSEQLKILNKFMKAIDGAPAGSTIRMAFFSLTVPDFVTKLIAAKKRGVIVRVLQDDHEVSALWLQLAAALGGDHTKPSWAMLCHRSCMSDEEPSYLHAKLYMFSSTYAVPYVTMVSSANPTYTQARIGWNDLYTVTRNSTIYNASKTYFEDLTRGAIQDKVGNQSVGVPIDEYFSATSGKYKTYYFPQAGDNRFEDAMWLVMKNISCWGAAYGYGSGGRTVVKIAMYQWSVNRVRLANVLWDLDNKGCIVEIIYDPSMTDPGIITALKAPGSHYGNPKLIPAREDRDRDGTPEHYVHNKFMLVSGVYAGDTSSKVVFTGSANWTNTALRYGNEITIKVNGATDHAAYLAAWERLRTWAVTLPTWQPPLPTPTPGPSPTIGPPTAPPTPPPTAPPTAPPPTASPNPSSSPNPSLAPGAGPNLFPVDDGTLAPNEALPVAWE